MEQTPCKLRRQLAQETEISREYARTATKLLKFQPYKTTIVPAVQPCDSIAKLDFCNYYLQPVHNGKTEPELTFFTDKA
jgi:hypothetical protein